MSTHNDATLIQDVRQAMTERFGTETGTKFKAFLISPRDAGDFFQNNSWALLIEQTSNPQKFFYADQRYLESVNCEAKDMPELVWTEMDKTSSYVSPTDSVKLIVFKKGLKVSGIDVNDPIKIESYTNAETRLEII